MVKNKFILCSKHQLIILIIIAIGLNINTLFNEYTIDDGVMMTENTLVQKGIKGIPKILTSELMSGFSRTETVLSELRYRPFSLVVFALEYQFFGANPMISHLINILFFTLLIALLYKLLQTYVFRERDKNLAFITCLIFAVHPIHTEVIASVKSRDELITFLLLLVSLMTFFKHIEKKRVWLLFISLFCFFLALLTRESAVTFIGVVPLMIYFFFNQSLKNSISFCLPFFIVFLGYMALRFSIIGFQKPVAITVLNSPFLYATTSQAFATKVFILIKYLCLLVFPYPLSWDYGFNQIPYIEVFSIQFISSLLMLLGLISYAIYAFKKKSIYSFSILYFMITISLVANFVVDIGTPLSERLLFQPSLAFCIVVAAVYIKIEKRSKVLIKIFFVAILLLFSLKTYLRNAEWKSNETLIFADVNSVPNSIRANQYATDIAIFKANAETNLELKNEYFKKAVFYGQRALKIYPDNLIVVMDLGSAYYGIHDYFNAADLWIRGYKMMPDNAELKKWIDILSNILYKQGNAFFEQGNTDAAIKCYLKSVELTPNNVEAWYNLGGNYFLNKDTTNATKAWNEVKKLDPSHQFKKDEFYKQ